MATLYEINRELASIFEALTSDPTPELEAEYRDFALQRDQKLAGWCGYLKNLEAEIEAVEAHQKYLKDRWESLKNQLKNGKRWVGYLLGSDKWTNGLHKLSWLKSEACVCTDNSKLLIPGYFKEEIVRTPDKKLIAQSLKEGADIPGWIIEQRNNLQVK